MGQILAWLFIVGLIVLGVSGLGQALRIWRRAQMTRQWAGTEGKVIASTVDTQWNAERKDYWVEYTYLVAGRQYTSRTVGFTASVRPRAHQERDKFKLYYVGALVTVYYDPQHPQNAVLQRDVPWSEIITMLLGGLVALIWAVLLIVPRPG
jgi:hypothetical protein